MLRKIEICQGAYCQNKGSKGLAHRIASVYAEGFQSVYKDLRIQDCECLGDCEQGPIVKVNDTLVLRAMDNQKGRTLVENPSALLGEAHHVQEEDQATFQRIVGGELF